jgi:hypothetical protein
MEDAMRTFALAIATAATVLTVAPATAQVYGPGDPDVSVRVGPGYDRYERWDRPRYRDRDYYAMRRGDCRMTEVRRQRPDGSWVVRRVRECG